MEIKCNVCGTINDSSSSYCKGCFLPLHKTMQQWTNDIENKINDSLDKIENVEPIKEENKDIWKERTTIDNSISKPIIMPGIQPLVESTITSDISLNQVVESPNIGIVSEHSELSNIPVEEDKVETTLDNFSNVNEEYPKTSVIDKKIDSSISLEPIVENQENNIEQLSMSNIPMQPIVENEDINVIEKNDNQVEAHVNTTPIIGGIEEPINVMKPIAEQNVDSSILTGETTVLPQIQTSPENVLIKPIIEKEESSSEKANSPIIITGNDGQLIEIEVSDEPVQAIIEPFTEEELADNVQKQNNDISLAGETTVLPQINSTSGVVNEVLEMPLESVSQNSEQPINEVQPLEEISENVLNQNNNLVDSIPLDKTFINQEALASTAQPYESGPIQGGKNINDIKNELQDASILKDDAMVDKGKSALKLTVKFDLILIILSLIFTFVYGININDTTNILFGALSTILFSAISIFVTFRKDIPKESEINKTYILIFTTMTLFEIIFRNILFYISNFNALYAYIFVNVLYILISIMIVNAISRFVRKNKSEQESSKFVSKMNIVVLIIIAILVVVGIVARNNSVEMKIEANPIPTTVPDELYTYIETVNDTIVTNIQNDENYEIPSTIDDPNFVENDLDLESVNLYIDEYGTVEKGEIKYDGISYQYQEKTFIVKG